MRFLHPFVVFVLSICLLAFTVLALASCGCSDEVADDTTTSSTVTSTTLTGTQETTTSTSVITESTATTASPTQSSAQQKVQVPDVVGMSRSGADSLLGSCGLECATELNPTCDPSAEGLVSAQNPAAGAWVSPHSVVTIEAWRYMVAVPNVIGMAEADATLALCGAGFSNVAVTYVITLIPSQMGKVMEQVPSAGVLLEPSATITLKVGETTPPVSM